MDITDIDTPALLIDLEKVEANLARAQDHANAHGLRLRPHVKTHKLPRFARRAQELGAIGVTCQKLGEAEAMADGGITDIFLPYNILGARKLDRLAALHGRLTIAVTADSAVTIAGYAGRFTDAGHPLKVLIECDTGAARCGVQTPEQALDLARLIAAAPGLTFGGLMVYPPRGGMAATNAWLQAAIALLTAGGLPPPVISTGGTPDFLRAQEITASTEYRPGTYIYGDRMQIGWGHGRIEDCALSVLATVVSRPTPTRAILDAGAKALAADQIAAGGHGHVIGHPGAVITGLSEEHAHLDISAAPDFPGIGQTVRVIPNHACVVTNLFDRAHLMQGDTVEEIAEITSRGKLT